MSRIKWSRCVKHHVKPGTKTDENARTPESERMRRKLSIRPAGLGPARKNRRRKYSPGRLGSPGAAELDGSYVGMRCGGLPGRTAVEYSNTPVSGRIAEDFSGPVYVA